MTKEDFVRKLYPVAKELGEISPIFTVAQAALESGWGKSAIGNNLFGITTGSSWTGKKKLVLTTEYFSTAGVKFKDPEKIVGITKISAGKYKYRVYRFFRDYDSLGDCLIDHQEILKRPQFKDAWPYRKDPIEYTKHIVDGVGGKYATDPGYVKTMTSLIGSIEKEVKRLGL